MYVKQTWTYGNRIEVRKHHTFRYGKKGERRSERIKPTPKQMADQNERNARRKLKRLMIENFRKGDWHITLTYKRENRPDVESSKALLKKFFRKLRVIYKRFGVELKYIIVTEWQGKSLHHHIAINNIPQISSVLTDLWVYGGVHMTPLYANQDYEGLADYFVKETDETYRRADNPYKQRWSCSRNLKRPEPEVEIVKADSWREDVRVPAELERAGYYLDKNSVQSGFDAFGYPFITYTFIKPERGQGYGLEK